MKIIKLKTKLRTKKDYFGNKSFFISKNRRNGNRQIHTSGSLMFYKAAGVDS